MKDLKLINGDIVIGEDGDLVIVEGDEQIAQEVEFRLKTTKGDWMLAPNCGASLEEFIGQPNTDIIRAAIERRVIDALSYDGLLYYPNVNAVAWNENEVFILVEFPSQSDSNKIIQVQSQLSLNEGLVFARTSSRNAL